MSKFGLILLAVVLACTFVNAEINWGGNAYYIYNSVGTGAANALIGDTDNSVGAFAQLIYAGANDTMETADTSQTDGIAVTSDDVVVDTRWMGDTDGQDGWWSSLQTINSGLTDLSYYYIRIWEDPSANYALGAIPSSNYNLDETPLWYYDAGDITPGAHDFDALTVNGTWMQTIPEPSSLAMIGVGLIVARIARRKRLS